MIKLNMTDNESKKEKIEYWKNSSQRDLDMMNFLFRENKFAYGLFFGQLGLEKLFKAVYLIKKDGPPPYVHNLAYLAGKCDLDIDKDLEEDLKEISSFNINARYDDYKESFYKRANKEFSHKYLLKIKAIEKWLKKEL